MTPMMNVQTARMAASGCDAVAQKKRAHSAARCARQPVASRHAVASSCSSPTPSAPGTVSCGTRPTPRRAGTAAPRASTHASVTAPCGHAPAHCAHPMQRADSHSGVIVVPFLFSVSRLSSLPSAERTARPPERTVRRSAPVGQRCVHAPQPMQTRASMCTAPAIARVHAYGIAASTRAASVGPCTSRGGAHQ